MIFRGMYEETVADLTKKGCGGIVSHIIHDYKNEASMTTPTSVVDNTYTPPKTKNENKNEMAVVGQTTALLPIQVLVGETYDSL